MAQLKDLIVNGSARVIGKLYSNGFVGNLEGTASNASKVNNLTVQTAVPANAKFTDTTYSSKAAASGGTDVSLVTTGEKATWNAKTSNTGTITKVQANGTDVASSGTANIPAASTSVYGVTKLSSATNSTSTSLAATASAVKSAYDRATNAASLIFTNVSVATTAFVSDTTYKDYPFKAVITCSNVTSNHVPTVNFSLADATSGNYAPVALSGSGNVTIYAVEKPTATVTIPSIVCVKGV